jgi:hypothetical protein
MMSHKKSAQQVVKTWSASEFPLTDVQTVVRAYTVYSS